MVQFMNTKLLGQFIEQSPYALNYGTKIVSAEGDIECVTQWRDIFTGNPLLRAWHGGVVSGVLELTGTLAAIKASNSQECGLLSINTVYLRPTRGDNEMFSKANVVRSGKHIQTINAVAWQNSFEAPTAIASLTFVSKW